MAAAKPQMPKKLRIGHLNYEVRSDRDTNAALIEDKLAGRSSGNLVWIEVRTSGYPYQTSAETLLHEVLHQALFAAGLNLDDEIEEPIIRALSMVLFGVLRDNPQFVKYLTFQE